jgi:uncharacterized protein (TIGR03437 family)
LPNPECFNEEAAMSKVVPAVAALLLVSVSPATAQPVIGARNSVVNSASYRTPGLPGAGIARGSIFSIFGTGLGPASPARAYTLPLPAELGKTSVAVTVGGTTVAAIILYTQNYQINAILPSSTPVGTGTIKVTYDGQTSAPAPIEVAQSAFGIYTFRSSGSGQAIATSTDYAPNTIARTFHPKDVALLWGTGLGPIEGDDTGLPPTGNLPGAIKVHVGNSIASVSYQGRSGCCAGLDQIAFQIPDDVQGCYVPVAVEAGGAVSNVATIAVSTSGSTCPDSVMEQNLVNKLAAGGTVNFGYVRLESLIAPVGGGQAGYASTDNGYATFSSYTRDTAGLAQYGVSTGYCIVVNCPYGCATFADTSPGQLDAGTTLTVQGPYTGSMSGPNFYYGYLSSQRRFLWSGQNYTVSGTGGQNVGPFSVMARSGPAGLAFSGIKGSQTLPLSGDLTVSWSGADNTLQNGNVTIGGYSGNDDLTKWVWLQCTAPAAPQKFTIPGWILSMLPPSGSGRNGSLVYPQGWLWIGQYNKPTEFAATGLDQGVYTDIFYNGLAIYFK